VLPLLGDAPRVPPGEELEHAVVRGIQCAVAHEAVLAGANARGERRDARRRRGGEAHVDDVLLAPALDEVAGMARAGAEGSGAEPVDEDDDRAVDGREAGLRLLPREGGEATRHHRGEAHPAGSGRR
jgi:hypothetical protein